MITFFIRILNNAIAKRSFLVIIVLLTVGINRLFAQMTTSKSDASCCDKSDGSASVSVSGGTPPYKYEWSNGKKDASISGLSAGTYSVVVRDANNCSGTATVKVGCKDCDDKCKTCPPPHPFPIPVLAGGDPNDITGPAGYDTRKWISVNDILPYTIRFENDPKIANAAVNKVVVIHPIDKNSDMFSFCLGDISFRNFNVTVPPNTSYFVKRLNLVDSIGIILDITAGLDVTKRQAFWIFQAFDPKTGLPNINPFLGFLAINDSITHNGEGKVRFSIKPKNNAITGDSIKAYASIVFDVNDPILTNTEFNTIDAFPPTSKIKSIKTIDSESKEITWSSYDDKGGSGVANYQLAISTNDEPYNTIIKEQADSSFILSLKGESNYKIQTIAIDHVNNTEVFNPKPDTIINAQHKKFIITPDSKSKYCVGGKLDIKWNTIKELFSFYLQISADSGKTFTSFGQQIFASDTIFRWNIQSSFVGNKYYLIRAINSANNLPVDTSEFFLIKNNISVNAGDDKILCLGDSTQVGGSLSISSGIFPYTYYWHNANNLLISSLSNPYVSSKGSYTITVKDSLGCSNSDLIYVDERQLPIVYIDGMNTLYCLNSIKDTLVVYPEGGFLSGTGITGNAFDPLVAGIGAHNIKYSYIDSYGCKNSITQTAMVNEPPIITFNGLNSAYCLNSDTVRLIGNPAGGVFTGAGILDTLFIPKLAGAGSHQITYSYTDLGGCSNSQTKTVAVIDLASITINGLSALYCVDADTVDIVGLPVGGVFTGDGIVDNKFIPAKAGVGTHQITYSFTDQNGGCSNSKTQQVEVVDLPTIAISGLDTTYCLSASPVNLTGMPANGVFSGNGITGNNFNPSLAGIGSHDITYTFADPNGCSNSKIEKVKVYGTPNVSFAGLNSAYCLNSGTATLIGSPVGGTFTGNGISGNSFSPLAAGTGTHQVSYLYTDQHACSSSQVQSVVVNSLPSVTFSGLDTAYCVNSGLVSLTGKPSGGRFSGNGIFGNTFNTSIAGLGKHTITYSYTDVNGCSMDSFMFVRINQLPSIFLGNDISITTVESTTLNAGNGFKNYKWSDGSTGQTLALSGAALGKGIHKFWVEVSDNNSCSATDTILVKVSDNVDIDIFNSLVKLQVYPNPSTGLFYLDIENGSSENIYVEVRNNAGQVVYTKKFKGRFENIKAEINLLGKAKGVYYINVKVKQEQVTRKIVII